MKTSTKVHAARILINEPNTGKNRRYWYPDLSACSGATTDSPATRDPSKVTCGFCKRLLVKVAKEGKKPAYP